MVYIVCRDWGCAAFTVASRFIFVLIFSWSFQNRRKLRSKHGTFNTYTTHPRTPPFPQEVFIHTLTPPVTTQNHCSRNTVFILMSELFRLTSQVSHIFAAGTAGSGFADERLCCCFSSCRPANTWILSGPLLDFHHFESVLLFLSFSLCLSFLHWLHQKTCSWMLPSHLTGVNPPTAVFEGSSLNRTCQEQYLLFAAITTELFFFPSTINLCISWKWSVLTFPVFFLFAARLSRDISC